MFEFVEEIPTVRYESIPRACWNNLKHFLCRLCALMTSTHVDWRHFSPFIQPWEPFFSPNLILYHISNTHFPLFLPCSFVCALDGFVFETDPSEKFPRMLFLVDFQEYLLLNGFCRSNSIHRYKRFFLFFARFRLVGSLVWAYLQWAWRAVCMERKRIKFHSVSWRGNRLHSANRTFFGYWRFRFYL